MPMYCDAFWILLSITALLVARPSGELLERGLVRLNDLVDALIEKQRGGKPIYVDAETEAMFTGRTKM